MNKGAEYIKDMHHIESGRWHQYDFQLVSRYGWEYMLYIAEYVAQADLGGGRTVTKADHPGGQEKEYMPAVKAAGGKIASCHELKNEGSVLSVGGYSSSIGTMVKITWLNQTDILRIFVLDKQPENIKEYANSIVAKTLDKFVAKRAGKAKKNAYKTTDGEKRVGSIIMTFLGSVWMVGATFMAFALDGFMPIGTMWFVISGIFMRIGIYGLGRYRKEKPVPAEQSKQKAAEPVKKQEQSVAPQPAPQPDKPKLWVIINKNHPVLPYMDGDRCIRLYRSQADANRYVAENFVLDLSSAHMEERQLAATERNWQKYGVKTVRIYSSYDEFTAHNCADAKIDSIDSAISGMIVRMIQDEKANAIPEQKVEWQTLQSELAQALKTTPLLVPFRYSDESDETAARDRQLHMTDAACNALSLLLKGEDGHSKKTLSMYYGINLLTGGRFEIMWNNGKIIYIGAIEKINEMMENGGDISLLNEHSGQLMHPMFVDNIQTKIHMVAAFTNLADLRAIYPNERVAAFTFEELVALASEGDGIVINPGKLGLNYQMPNSFLNKVTELMKQPMKFYSLPQEYVGKRKVVLTETGENKIKVIRILRQVTGADLTTAKSMSESTPVTVKSGIVLGEAQLIINMLQQAGAKAEIVAEE